MKALETHEFVSGTRYGVGFDVDASWPWYRVVISKVERKRESDSRDMGVLGGVVGV